MILLLCSYIIILRRTRRGIIDTGQRVHKIFYRILFGMTFFTTLTFQITLTFIVIK